MATLRGPMLSLRAAGGFGETLTYAESLGRPYVKAWQKPRTLETVKQRAIRSAAGFCLKNWGALTAPEAESFRGLAVPAQITPRNAFLGYNVARWRSFRGLSAIYPAADTTGTGWVSALTSDLYVRGIRVNAFFSSANDCWAVPIFRELATGFTPAWSNLRFLPLFTGPGWNRWTDEPLAPGTYYYRVGRISRDGNFLVTTLETSQTVV